MMSVTISTLYVWCRFDKIFNCSIDSFREVSALKIYFVYYGIKAKWLKQDEPRITPVLVDLSKKSQYVLIPIIFHLNLLTVAQRNLFKSYANEIFNF